MDRQNFLRGCCALTVLSALSPAEAASAAASDEANPELKFIQNWLSDLMTAIDTGVDEPTKIKLMSFCGEQCFRRHQFKRDIAAKGKGSVDKLIEAYRSNFEIWREGDKVHVRFGEVSPGCYCSAARYREPRPNDLHCYCSRATQQAIWEAAMGRKYKIDILESVRRGARTCHFLVHLT